MNGQADKQTQCQRITSLYKLSTQKLTAIQSEAVGRSMLGCLCNLRTRSPLLSDEKENLQTEKGLKAVIKNHQGTKKINFYYFLLQMKRIFGDIQYFITFI